MYLNTSSHQPCPAPPDPAPQVDMDYENLSRPPPAPTEEATTSLEDMIKRRIAEAR